MPYDSKLADRIRAYLNQFPELKVEEKKCSMAWPLWLKGKCA
jgi:hypothetical protein